MNQYIQLKALHTMDLEEPRPGDIDLVSVIGSLAHQVRFNGHAGRYSIAEHLVLGTEVLELQGANLETQIAYLFHDAHEAFTGDIPAPVKRIPWLKEPLKRFEKIHIDNMKAWLGLDDSKIDHMAVLNTDLAMCVAEAQQSFGELVGPGWPNVPPADVRLQYWGDEHAKRCLTGMILRKAPALFDRPVNPSRHASYDE